MTATAWSSNDSLKSAQWKVAARKKLFQTHALLDAACTDMQATVFKRDRPWDKRAVLSLDAGGVRGYSSLLMLRALMREVEKVERSMNLDARSSAYSPLIDCSTDEDFAFSASQSKATSAYRPCHYFDFIAGTGTGGLIAIMLGRLRMSVDAAIEEYMELSTKVFGKPSSRIQRSWTGFNSRTRMVNFRQLVGGLCPVLPSPLEEDKEFESDVNRCKTIVSSASSDPDKDDQNIILFCSYKKGPTIWEVARTTSATPTYFKPTKLGKHLYYDSAAPFYNPTWDVLSEVKRVTGYSNAVDLLISIGGGNFEYGTARRLFGGHILHQNVTRVDPIHDSVLRESKEQHFNYCRFNVDGLEAVRVDEWVPNARSAGAFRQIEDSTEQYLQTLSVAAQIRDCAKTLVLTRLRRAHTMQWERFATGIRYKCPLSDCSRPFARYQDRGELLDHLRRVHNTPPPDVVHKQDVRRLLDEGRTNSE